MKLSYAHILKCSDNSYYTGITSNLTKRINEHNTGKHIDSYTYSRRPVSLVFYAELQILIWQSRVKNKSKNGLELKRKR